MKLSVVVPLYNEEVSFPVFFPALAGALSSVPGAEVSYVLVNDGSTDGTQSALERIAAGRKDVSVRRLFLNGGHQRALVEGLRAAPGADAYLMLDGDGQHPAAVARRLLEAMVAADPPADLVQAVRKDGQDGGKRFFSNLFYRTARKLVPGLDLMDGESDFRIVSAPLKDELLASPLGRKNLRVFFGRVRCRRVRMPYAAEARIAGRSKYSLPKMARLAVDGLFGASFLPLRLSHVVSAAMFLLSAVLFGQALWARLAGRAVPGWTTLVGLLCLCFAGVFAVLAILSEYVILLLRLEEDRRDGTEIRGRTP